MVPVLDQQAFKRQCQLNGVSISGVIRSMFRQFLDGDIKLDFDAIRKEDYEQRMKNMKV